MWRDYRLAVWMLVLTALPALACAQGLPSGAGGQGRQGGRGNLNGLVPRGIEAIVAYPVDNSIIVKATDVDAGDSPLLTVRAQHLELTRAGSNHLVRQFRAYDSAPVTLASGQTGVVTIRTASRTLSYPLQVKLEKDGTISMTVYQASADSSGARPASASAKGNLRVLYRLDKKEQVRPGESIVVSGMIAPQSDGGQRETYLQFSFELVEKSEAKTTTASPPAAPASERLPATRRQR
jgi:hypothetical protein